MPKIDYNKMSLEELIAERAELDAVILRKQEAQRAEFKDKIVAEARLLNIDLSDLVGKARRGRPPKSNSDADGLRASPAPKYASLKDPTKTWSGRGIMASWMKEEIAEAKKHGKKLTKEDFLIHKIAA